MATSTSFHITRQNLFHPDLSIDYTTSSLESDLASLTVSSPSLIEKVDLFFKEQKAKLRCINESLSLKSLEELKSSDQDKHDKYTDIKTIMQTTHSIGLTRESVSNLLSIWQFLRTVDAVKALLEETPQRFKIAGFCSITIFRNQLIVHLKKAATKCIIGYGATLTATRAIQISEERVALTAELTRTSRLTDLPPEVTLLSKERDFLTFPALNYRYKGPQKKREIEKECKIFPLYNTDFFSALTYHALYSDHTKQPFFTHETQWKMFCFIIKSLKTIHANGLVYRDLKPENCLLSFEINPTRPFDPNSCGFAICDFELVARESTINESTPWVGTEESWPEWRKFPRESQKQPSDIYAMGLLSGFIFAVGHSISTEEDSLLSSLYNSMTEADPSRRPKITDIATCVKDFLKANHEEYSWIEDFFPD